MKRTFTHLFALLCCLAASLSASAQYKADIEMYPQKGYDPASKTFSLTEVATALGTDTATFVHAIEAWMEEEAPTEFYFRTSTFTPAAAADYTADNRGFWMKLDGTVVSYGDDAQWYSFFTWDATKDEFNVVVGQMPNKLVADDEGKVTYVIAYGEKTVSFDITLKVIAKPVVEIPEPTLKWAELNIVGEQTVEVRQYPRGGYDSSKQEVDLTGVAELLGTTDDVIAENLDTILWATVQISTEEDAEFVGDSLTNVPTAGGYGWWFGRLWDKTNEVPANEVAACTWGDGKNRSFFSEAYAYDAETHILSSNIGQEGGLLKVGDELTATLYLVWGNKGYKLSYKLIIEEAPVVNPDDLVEAGSKEYDCEFYVSASDYAGTSITVDVDAVCELLGVEKSELAFKATADETGAMTDQPSANNGGYWLNAEGYRSSYGEGYFFIEPNTSGDFSTFSVGQYPGKLEAGTVYTAKLYLVGGGKYYTIILNVKPTEKPKVEVEFENVATKSITIQFVPANSYAIEMTGELDLAELEELTGTTNLTLYGTAAPKEDDPEGTVNYSDAYSCTPYPGFWMASNGYVSTWGASQPWGVTYSGGIFTFYQYPNNAENAEGATYKATFYLVNEANGKMVTVEITVQAVSQIVKADEVGSMTIVLPLNTTRDESTFTEIDMTEAVTALGVEDATDMLSSTQPLKVTLADGSFNNGMSPSEGAGITAAGYLDENENLDNSVYILYLEAGEGNTVTFEVNNYLGTFEAGQRINTKAAIEVPAVGDANAKRFILNLVVVDEDAYTGVSDIKAAAASGAIYDLSGRRVESATRGIYIVNGQKVVK